MELEFTQIRDGSVGFSQKLNEIKRGLNVDFPWYPYDTMANFYHMENIIASAPDGLFAQGRHYADIGAADGDLAFYLESLGNSVDIYDYGPTNMNGLRGARCMKKALNSKVGIYERDLDSQFDISHRYDLIFFFGILYHLKNPFFILERLADSSSYLLLSTRIARFFDRSGSDISQLPISYLVGSNELNNDPTNFWIFSEVGLKRLIDRAGWDLLGFQTVGDTTSSTPFDNHHDERAFAFIKSRNHRFWI